MPRLGAPAILRAGERLEVYFSPEHQPRDDWRVRLVSPFSMLEANVVNTASESRSVWRLTVDIPRETARDLYDLVLYHDAAPTQLLVEPNSVFVVGETFPKSLRLAVISDLHYGVGPYYAQTTKVLRRTLSSLSSIGLDLIVCCGDVVDATGEEASFLNVAREFTSLRIPILLAGGNNDHYAVERGFHHWEKHLAPSYFSLAAGKHFFLALNSRGGSIDDEQLAWAERQLSAQPKDYVKVIVLHHPYYSEPHQSLSKRIPDMIKAHEISLVLSGHTHRDSVQLAPTLTITTTSLSDSGPGYRLLNLTESRIEYTTSSRPHDTVAVDYLQRNDHTSTGFAATTRNNLEETQHLTLTFLLKSPIAGTTPKVEGGELTRFRAAVQPDQNVSTQVELKLPPRSERIVKTFFQEDLTPPSITASLRVEGRTVVVLASASDIGFGVVRLTVYFSEDNSSWIAVPPKIAERVEQYTFSATKPKMYVKVEAIDAATLKAVKVEAVSIADLAPRKSEPTSPQTDIIYVTGLISAIVATFIFLLKRRSRKASEG